jgi:hypothetical protein
MTLVILQGSYLASSNFSTSTFEWTVIASAPLPLSPASLPAPGVLLRVLPLRLLDDLFEF